MAEELSQLEEKPVAIGGMTMGADPISLAIAMESSRQNAPLQMFSVRKEAKKYGTGKRVEGNFSEGDTIILVEDTATTGGSTIKAMDAIEAEGGKVSAAPGITTLGDTLGFAEEMSGAVGQIGG